MNPDKMKFDLQSKSYVALFVFLVILMLIPNISKSENRKVPNNIDSLIDFQSRKFKFILQTAYLYRLDSIDVNKTCDAAFSSLLTQFDKQSAYYSAEDLKLINESNAGSGVSVGIEPVILNDSLIIAGISEFSSADSAGVKKGDRILFINGQKIFGLKLSEIKAKLSPKAGEKVEVIVKDAKANIMHEYVLTSNEIEIPAINAWFMIKGTNVGYIYAKSFNAKSDSIFEDVAKKLKKSGMKKLILDLRGNPGGYVNQVSKIIDLFIPKGYTITKTHARDSNFVVSYESTDGGELEDLPIVILIDGSSASASEIFAGAMQDLDRGLVLGEISFGKGTVQNFWSFLDGSGFRLTVGKYLTPAGREIQKTGDLTGNNTDFNDVLKLNMDAKSIDALKKSMEKTGGKTQLPIFKSRKGRSIIGGGSIYPDSFIATDTTTLLTKYWKQNGIFLEFALNYYINHEKELNSKYKNNISSYLYDFTITDDDVNKCVELGKSKNLWNEAMFRQDKEVIIDNIKRYIAYTIWDDKGFDSAKILGDKTIEKALELMPSAEKMLNQF